MAFGGVWKDSLTELSGGQRSLLALSLILAMLLFKPAPIYILDEVILSLCGHSSTAVNLARDAHARRPCACGEPSSQQNRRSCAVPAKCKQSCPAPMAVGIWAFRVV